MKVATLFIFFILIFLSCRNDTSPAILPPEKMEAVLLDFIMAEMYTNVHVNIDSVTLAQRENARLQKKIFSRHGITKAQFENSFDYYSLHTDKMTKILDSLVSKENRRNSRPIKAIRYE